MLIRKICLLIAFCSVGSVHYEGVASETSADENVNDQSANGQSSLDSEDIENEDSAIKHLADALKVVLDKNSVLPKDEELDSVKKMLEEILSADLNMLAFMKDMDKLSNDVCKRCQAALWNLIDDSNNVEKQEAVVRALGQQNRARKEYWHILKTVYLKDDMQNDPQLDRKIRMIKEKGINVIMPDSKEKELISNMQNTWIKALVCAYNTSCMSEHTRRYSDIISTFKTSTDSDELLHYWKVFHDATGRKIRPTFKKYVDTMNVAARAENFTDAGELWRFTFEDKDLAWKVKLWWGEMKPLYDLLRKYVKKKLRLVYESLDNGSSIPAHLLGNLWAQDWQSLYPLIAPYPDTDLMNVALNISSVKAFLQVDEFHHSLGFESTTDGNIEVDHSKKEGTDCISSSYDMCDGKNYKIRLCDKHDEASLKDVYMAGYLLSQIQYFRHYRDRPLHFREAPTPAFKEAIPNIIATQMTLPEQLKRFKLLKTELDTITPDLYLNHLMWLALEKLPLAAYAYALDTWRWDIFSGTENWNEHWWNIRWNETGISPPIYRNESDLDPASKFHVVSNSQYITYLISPILEFQILRGLCKTTKAKQLHKCSLYGSKKAGESLSKLMSRGSTDSWRSVLFDITGDKEISTKGLLEYFKPLEEFLNKEVNSKSLDKTSMSIAIGATVAVLIILIVLGYCMKKSGLISRMIDFCGLTRKGTLDIATEDIGEKTIELTGITEAKM